MPLLLLAAAIRICPLAATRNRPWPSQSVTGFGNRRVPGCPERRTIALLLRPPRCAEVVGSLEATIKKIIGSF